MTLVDVVVLVIVCVPGWVHCIASKDCAFGMVVVVHAALAVLISVAVGSIIGVDVVWVLERARVL